MGARFSLTVREIKKWYRNPLLFVISLVQPLFWILLFGNAFNITNLVPVGVPGRTQLQQNIMNSFFLGASNYISFLTPGMMSVLIIFTAMFSGMSIIWDRRFGFLNKLLVSPIPRDSIVTSKIFAGVIKAMVPVLVLFFIALIIPNGLILSPTFGIIDFLVILTVLFLLSLGFSSFFTAIIVRVKKWETVMGFANLINLPLMFASTALFPSSIMPDWLKTVASYNPVSWAADAMRLVMIKGSLTASQISTVIGDLEHLTVFVLVMLLIVYLISKWGFEE